MLAVSVEHVAELFAQSRKLFCRNVKVLQEELLPDHIRRQLDQFLFGIGLVCFGACIDVLQKLLRRFCCVNMIHMKEAPQSADIIAVTLRGSVLCMYGASNIEENSLYHNNSSRFSFFSTLVLLHFHLHRVLRKRFHFLIQPYHYLPAMSIKNHILLSKFYDIHNFNPGVFVNYAQLLFSPYSRIL